MITPGWKRFPFFVTASATWKTAYKAAWNRNRPIAVGHSWIKLSTPKKNWLQTSAFLSPIWKRLFYLQITIATFQWGIWNFTQIFVFIENHNWGIGLRWGFGTLEGNYFMKEVEVKSESSDHKVAIRWWE